MDDEEADGFFEAAFFGKVEKVIKHCAYPIYSHLRVKHKKSPAIGAGLFKNFIVSDDAYYLPSVVR